MGKLRKGLFGGFTGKAGNLVGSTYRGVEVVKTVPGKDNWTPTPAQAECRKKMAAINKILRPFKFAIRRGYIANGVPTEWNLAIKDNYPKLVANADGDYELPAEDISLTNGSVTFDVTIDRNGDTLTVSWTTPGINDLLYGADVHLVLYNPANGRVALHSFASSANEGSASCANLKADEGEIRAYSFASTSDISSITNYSVI